MSGIPCWFSNQSGGSSGFTRISTFAKLNTPYTHDTAIVDLNAGTLGYIRLSWSTDAGFVAEASYRGCALQLFLTPSPWTLQVNQWYWLSFVVGDNAGVAGHFYGYGQVWGPGGVSPGLKFGEGGPPMGVSYTDQPACALGWGTPLSSIYNPWPLAVGDELAELVVETGHGTQNATDANAAGVRSQPAGQLSPGGYIVALYHPTESLSSDITIHDSSGNGYHLSPSPHNQVLNDSPFL